MNFKRLSLNFHIRIAVDTYGTSIDIKTPLFQFYLMLNWLKIRLKKVYDIHWYYEIIKNYFFFMYIFNSKQRFYLF